MLIRADYESAMWCWRDQGPLGVHRFLGEPRIFYDQIPEYQATEEGQRGERRVFHDRNKRFGPKVRPTAGK